ncbi:uncharacterized protein LOC110690070 [Chenopodium quinoa]|uniref:uncharacterized protein LOC110690070 n=1 Tax=Chenopodium quinoa TaxID=63459 RepID=UPI000B78C12C|nr:uncharacterized protein LOC110690070 [Chenopodium quinoa]
MSVSNSSIRELNSSKNDWKIKVRVSRLFDVLNFRKHNSLISLDMVLIDEVVDYVHASIKGKFVQQFRSKLIEGKVYTIRYFSVVPNKNEYRVVSDNKIMIQFFQNTSVKGVADNNKIPLHIFDFVQLQHLDKFCSNATLPDVVGMVVKEIGDSIEIEDKCEKLDNATIGKLEIQHINIGPEEINSKKVDILILMNHVQKTLEKDLIFYCIAKVDTIMSENSWYYISCPACKRRISPRKTDFWCIPCEKQIERPIPRYRLELSVIDHSGSTIFVVFYEEAKKLVGQDASTLFEAHIYEKINDHNDDDNDDDNDNEDDDTQIPKMIANIIGRELVFKNKNVIKNNEDISKDEVTVVEETAKRLFDNIDSTEKNHDSSDQITSKKIKV